MFSGNPLANDQKSYLWGGGWFSQVTGLEEVSNLAGESLFVVVDVVG
jgi:hypothetical protein